MTFKRLAMATALGTSMFSGVAAAELSGNVGVVSQYLFRGLSQSDGAAVQGGLDYVAPSGFYVGAWASTIGFGGTPNLGGGGSTGAELDLYAGFSGEAGSVGYDLGIMYYVYLEEDEVDKPDPSYNTLELYGSLTFGPITLGGYFAPDTYFGADDSAYGINVALAAPISDKLTFDAFLGHNGGKGNKAFTPDGKSYLDFKLGVSSELENGFSFGMHLVATDIKDDDPKVVLSGGYSFGL